MILRPAPRKQNFLQSIFGGGDSGGKPAAAPTAPAPAPSATPSPVPAPAVPNDPVAQLDSFKSLWQTPTDSDGKPIAPAADPLSQPLFQLDPKKVTESAQSMNFAAGIPAETLAKIAAGGEEAAVAFQEALNIGIRNAVAGITLSQGNFINQALMENNKRVSAALPVHIKRNQLLTDDEEDPVLAHPAVQPLVKSLKQVAFSKDPNASPAEINKQIAGYLRGLGLAMHETDPSVVAAKQKTSKGDPDYSVFLAD